MRAGCLRCHIRDLDCSRRARQRRCRAGLWDDPNATEMDVRWEHNLLADTNNVAAYFDHGRLTSTMANPFDGPLPDTGNAQGSVWDGIGSELPDMSDVQRNVWDGIDYDMWNWDTTG
jgi:hypothetical protein